MGTDPEGQHKKKVNTYYGNTFKLESPDVSKTLLYDDSNWSQ